MRDRLQSAFTSVSMRLWWRVFLATVVVLAVYGVVAYQSASRRWQRNIEACAVRTSALVGEATHTGMLTNRKGEVESLIARIAGTEGVEAIRVWRASGEIFLSSDGARPGPASPPPAPCAACHIGQARPPEGEQVRLVENPGGRQLQVLTPIFNEPGCRTADCHAHDADGPMLGALDVRMSLTPLEEALSFIGSQQTLATLTLTVVVSLVLFIPFDRLIRRPVRRLVEGHRKVAEGHLDTRLPANGHDEMAELARAFNRMTEELGQAHLALTGWSRRLEAEVEEQAEALGQAHKQLLHMEKMASLGKLAATVAHEINNPLSGILTYARLVERELDAPGGAEAAPREDVRHFLHFIQRESHRCGDIVRNLLLFARQGHSAPAPGHLDDVVDRAVMLVRHHSEMSHVELDRQDALDDDTVVMDAGQIEQALVALFINAVEALQGREDAHLGVHTAGDHDRVRITVRDNGPGIPAEVLPHIFEPFFSTKSKGSGMGLGLSVAYGIVQRHGGDLEVTSQPGQGTTFLLSLPRRPPATPDQETRE